VTGKERKKKKPAEDTKRKVAPTEKVLSTKHRSRSSPSLGVPNGDENKVRKVKTPKGKSKRRAVP